MGDRIFPQIYEANRQEASAALLGNEPLVEAIEALLNDTKASGAEKVWSGTATKLLEDLAFYADDAIKRSRVWPGGPQALSHRMRRLAPALRSAGIEYAEGEEGHRKKKVKTLTRPLREHEKTEDPAQQADREVKEEASSTEAPGGGNRLPSNPFAFDFSDDAESDEGEQDEEEEDEEVNEEEEG